MTDAFIAGGFTIVGVIVGTAASGVVGNWLQQNQRTADREAAERRASDERANRTIEAMRAWRRERLLPVFALLTEIGGRIGHDLWAPWIREAAESEQMRNAVREQVTKAVTDAGYPTDAVDRIEKGILDELPKHFMTGLELDPKWTTLFPRAVAACHGIADEQLRRDFLAFAGMKFADDIRKASTTLSGLYERLDAYAASVNAP